MDAHDLDLSRILPAFMAAQTDDVAFAQALSAILRARAVRCEQIGIWDAISSLDEQALDFIAKALHIEWWRGDWSLAEKREMLGMAEQIRAGVDTHWALETLLQKWFGDDELIVEEWWSYGGLPYTFRILCTSVDVQMRLRFSKIMDTVKRTSQSMDGIFVGFSMRGTAYVGEGYGDYLHAYGEGLSYRYLPKGTTIDGWDGYQALSVLLQQANPGQDTSYVFDECFDYALYKVTSDMPLTFVEDETPEGFHAIPSTRAAGARLDAALADHWSGVGASISDPAVSYSWPPASASAADLLTGLAHFWGGGTSTSALDLSDSVEGGWALTNAPDWTGNAVTAGKGIFGGGFVAVTASKYAYSNNRNFLAADCSVALWVKPLSAPTGGARFVRIPSVKAVGHTSWAGTQLDIIAPTPSSWYRLGLQCVPGSDPAVTVEADAPASFAVGGWNLLVLTWDATNGIATLWANGEKIIEADGVFIANNRTLNFGIAGASGDNGVAGTYDEVAVWTRVLGQAEVQALWNGGSGLPFEDWT